MLHFSQPAYWLAELTNSCDWLQRSALYRLIARLSVTPVWRVYDTSRFLGDYGGERFYAGVVLWSYMYVYCDSCSPCCFLLWSVLSSNYYERRWLWYVSLLIRIMFPCFPVLPFSPLQFGPTFSRPAFSIPAFSVRPLELQRCWYNNY